MSEIQKSDERPEDWYAKPYDMPVFGGLSLIVTAVILILGHDARARYPWFLTAWVMVLIWAMLTNLLIHGAYRRRLRRNGRENN